MSDDVRRAPEIDVTAAIADPTIDIITTGRRTGWPRRIEIVFHPHSGWPAAVLDERAEHSPARHSSA